LWEVCEGVADEWSSTPILRKAWDGEFARKEALDERRAERHVKIRPDMPSLATSGIQLVQPESRFSIALVGCRPQQDARLVTIFSHSMTPSETIRQG
jgi:regulatory protein YycI of two-component signal transduction system YycFG